MIARIKELIKECIDENKIYLLVSLDSDSGFFSLNQKVIYMKASTTGEKKAETVNTEKLSLSTGVHVMSVNNDSTFEPGFYDYILFDGNVNDADFVSFIKICQLFTNETEKMSLRDFFFSILEMFQLPREQQYKNLIGLMGELSVIKFIYEKTGVSVASGWHENSTDKYDINHDGLIIEVKTTTSDLYTVKIKHEQLFGKKGIILAAVRVMDSNAGFTLFDLIDGLNQLPVFAEDFRFQLELGKELKRVSPQDSSTKKIEVKGIRFYKNNDIPTIGDIPDNITGIEYNCTLIETNETDISEVID